MVSACGLGSGVGDWDWLRGWEGGLGEGEGEEGWDFEDLGFL
jgi:hypothetical protein